MLKNTRQPLVIALILLTFLALGSVAAEARDITKGSDNLLKGAVVGAIAGTATQVIRGHDRPRQVLGGAAVGGAIGAGVGAYVDYREERVARESERKYDRYRGDDRYGRYDRGYNRGYNRRGRGYSEPVYYNDAPRHGRGRGNGHHKRCR
ncbi:MAG TPA: hypothetical protein VHC97_01960 [Thermoanaerobaculia bacterium]|jgi:hypothetical protein|nr:hypothetical protein [Thermoanaerobaculia bacterium]